MLSEFEFGFKFSMGNGWIHVVNPVIVDVTPNPLQNGMGFYHPCVCLIFLVLSMAWKSAVVSGVSS